MRKAIEALQPLGRALMLPIAVLPVAALLLRLGQPDLLNIAFVSAAGDAIFANLGLLFAVGVATGFARDGNGAAALAGVVCFLITRQGLQIFIDVPADALKGVTGDAVKMATTAYKQAAAAKLEVPIGIVAGLIGGHFYNRFATIKVPEYLAFFGGRRFVPIASGLAGLMLAALLGLGYARISVGMDALSHGIVSAGGFGLFIYGVLNRLLLVTGLHHIINNVVWFLIGDYQGATGDLRRFFAGDPHAGAFMSGFFPVMMFGLPAACLAMYHEAPLDQRKRVGGMLGSLALTSFLTGVTEPIEFSFMFLAPLLYALHALLTGASMALMQALDVHLGFGFSAGLFDYVLNFGKAKNPLLLLPVGLAYALVYYTLFRVVIRKLDLKTPGRDKSSDADEDASGRNTAADGRSGGRGAAFVAALGGAGNLTSVDACTTRLRLIVGDQGRIDETTLKQLGARGIIKPSANAVQIVLGPVADAVAMDMRDAIGNPPQPATPPAAVETDAALDRHPSSPAPATLSPELAEALGGTDNIVAVAALHGRLRLVLKDAGAADLTALPAPCRGAMALPGGVVHLLIDPAG